MPPGEKLIAYRGIQGEIDILKNWLHQLPQGKEFESLKQEGMKACNKLSSEILAEIKRTEASIVPEIADQKVETLKQLFKNISTDPKLSTADKLAAYRGIEKEAGILRKWFSELPRGEKFKSLKEAGKKSCKQLRSEARKEMRALGGSSEAGVVSRGVDLSIQRFEQW